MHRIFVSRKNISYTIDIILQTAQNNKAIHGEVLGLNLGSQGENGKRLLTYDRKRTILSDTFDM